MQDKSPLISPWQQNTLLSHIKLLVTNLKYTRGTIGYMTEGSVASNQSGDDTKKERRMEPCRDVYQRKIYALTRMNRALARMKKAMEEAERAKALCWVNAWLAASGLRQFKLGPPSGKVSRQPQSSLAGAHPRGAEQIAATPPGCTHGTLSSRHKFPYGPPQH